MQANPIELIHKFNHDAGLVEKGYNDFLESSFQIEEALEGFSSINLSRIGQSLFKDFPHSDKLPKHIARGLMVYLNKDKEHTPYDEVYVPLSDVDRLDKACDAVVFAIGSMTKLGLSVDQITRSLNTVMSANFQKLTMPKDSHGKLMKPDDFVGPEEALQKILDERQ